MLVETNWVYELIAPDHTRSTEAAALFDAAAAGDVRIYLPAICLREARDAVRFKFQGSAKATKSLREFRRWSVETKKLSRAESDVVARFLDQYVLTVEESRSRVDARIKEIEANPGIETFGLSDAMLAMAIELRTLIADRTLNPFDEAILGAVLVRAKELRDSGIIDPIFCSTDSDTSNMLAGKKSQPPSQHLALLFGQIGLRAQHGFALNDA